MRIKDEKNRKRKLSNGSIKDYIEGKLINDNDKFTYLDIQTNAGRVSFAPLHLTSRYSMNNINSDTNNENVVMQQRNDVLVKKQSNSLNNNKTEVNCFLNEAIMQNTTTKYNNDAKANIKQIKSSILRQSKNYKKFDNSSFEYVFTNKYNGNQKQSIETADFGNERIFDDISIIDSNEDIQSICNNSSNINSVISNSNATEDVLVRKSIIVNERPLGTKTRLSMSNTNININNKLSQRTNNEHNIENASELYSSLSLNKYIFDINKLVKEFNTILTSFRVVCISHLEEYELIRDFNNVNKNSIQKHTFSYINRTSTAEIPSTPQLLKYNTPNKNKRISTINVHSDSSIHSRLSKDKHQNSLTNRIRTPPRPEYDISLRTNYLYSPFRITDECNHEFIARTPKKDETKQGISNHMILKEFENITDQDVVTPETSLPLSSHFYAIFNNVVFDNKLPNYVNILWSNRLTSSAGLTKIITSETKEGKKLEAKISISLSKKLLINVYRLRKTLLHEMCHVAQFFLGKEKEVAHGPIFMKWAKHAHQFYPEIPVTKTHNYDEAKYKHKWICQNCNHIYKRITKSVDVKEVRCGKCLIGEIAYINKTK